MTDGSPRGWFRALVLVAAVCLGQALAEGNGNLFANAIVYLTVVAAAVFLCTLFPRAPDGVERLFAWLTPLLAVIGLASFCGRDVNMVPGMYVRAFAADYRPFLFTFGGAAVLAGAAFAWSGSKAMRGLAVIALCGVFVYLGHWMLSRSTDPRIDVFVFHRDALKALLDGHSPYAITFQDIYSARDTARFYGPDLTVGGRLQFGFPYFPLSLLLVLPAHLITGDFRYAQVAALVLASLAMFLAAPKSRWTALAPALLLFMPRTLFVLEQSWTEPLLVGLFALTVLVAARWPRWVWLPLGLFIAAKQYAFLAAPLALLVLPRPWRLREIVRVALLAAAVVIVITLPFYLWAPQPFVRSVVLLQFHQPFREEALSYMAWAYKTWKVTIPGVTPFLAAALMLALTLWRAPRTPAGFAFGSAAVLFSFFALNKQAFANYYFLVEGMLCCAIAASELRPRPRTASLDPPRSAPSSPAPPASS